MQCLQMYVDTCWLFIEKTMYMGVKACTELKSITTGA